MTRDQIIALNSLVVYGPTINIEEDNMKIEKEKVDKFLKSKKGKNLLDSMKNLMKDVYK